MCAQMLAALRPLLPRLCTCSSSQLDVHIPCRAPGADAACARRCWQRCGRCCRACAHAHPLSWTFIYPAGRRELTRHVRTGAGSAAAAAAAPVHMLILSAGRSYTLQGAGS